MAERKRTQFERENDYETITSLYLRGVRQVEIATQLNLSRQQIGYDLKIIQRRWQEKTIIDLDESKNKELSRIDELERVYWQAWQDSKCEKIKAKQETSGKGRDGKPIVTRATAEKEQMLGNPAYLSGVQWCISERCKLLGLNAPIRVDSTNRSDQPVRVIVEYTDDADE